MDTSGVNLFGEASTSRHVIPPLFHSLSVGSPGSSVGLGLGSAPSTPLSVTLSPRSLALYSSEDTVESVIGQLLLVIFMPMPQTGRRRHNFLSTVPASALSWRQETGEPTSR